MSSSSSSSSSDEEEEKRRKKEKKKEKKEKKKEKKKAKKEKKKAKKEKKEKRGDVVYTWPQKTLTEGRRLLREMVEADATCQPGVENMFKRLEKGSSVDVSGIPDPRFRKKLRHLLQLAGCTADEDGFTKPATCENDLRTLLRQIGTIELPKKEAPVPPPKGVAKGPAPAPSPRVAEASASSVGPEGPRKFGVMMKPEGYVAPAADSDSDSDREKFVGMDSDDDDDDAGPKPEGEERAGVDMEALAVHEKKRKREEWMLVAPKWLGGFDEPNGQDKFAAKKSKKEIKKAKEQIEAHKKKMGAESLVDQLKAGKVAGKDVDHGEVKAAWGRSKVGSDDMWGMSEKEQAKSGGAKKQLAGGFDPEKEFKVRKAMTNDDYQKLLANSKEWGGRFASSIETSFL